MMKRILPVFLFALGFLSVTNAQLNYTISYPTTTFTALTSATNAPLLNASRVVDGAPTSDEGVANNISIPFTFNYNGFNYDRFNICTNGFITLGTTAQNAPLDTFTALWQNALANGPLRYDGERTSNRPVIAPLWDDLDMINITNVKYRTTGTAPNRVLTIEWLNAKWGWQATAACVSFQVKLYETTNVIEFIYRQQTGTLNSASATIGISDVMTGSGNFLSQSTITATATSSSTTETGTIATKPVSNFAIRYTPIPIPANDANMWRLISAPVVSTCVGWPESVAYVIKNSGTSPIAAGAANIELTITGPNPANYTKANTKTIAFNEFDTVIFDNINLNASGINLFTAIANLSNDGRRTNDTSRYSYTTATSVTSFPVQEDARVLTGFPYLATFNGSQMWRRFNNSGITIPNNATPLEPFITNDPDDTAYYVALTRYLGVNSDGWSSLLYSNCFSLPAGLQPNEYNLAFYMTQDSAQSNNVNFTGDDSIYVRISEDSGASWQRVAGFNRNDPGLSGFTWVRQSVPLDAFAGKTIQIGFEAISALGNVIGLDSITVTANQPLPVKWLSFEGNREGNRNILTWKTTNELNNKGFEIQRGHNGIQYTTIAFINSKATNGNSSSTINYNFTDEKPLNSNNYYRLRQVDINGKESFSSIVMLRPATSVKAEITKLYPNPVSVRLNVVLNTVNAEKVTVKITDLTGRVIEVKNIETTIGDNNLSFNTSNLAKGTYLMKVSTLSNVEIATQKFVKM